MIISVQKVSKHYRKRAGDEVVRAVDNVSFAVDRGEVLGLLGPNGAGKTTTIKMICGLIRPDSGTIIVNSIDNQRRRLQALRHISAVLEGNRNLYWRLTARENLEYFAGNRGRSRRSVRKRVDELLESFQLVDKAQEVVNNLSRGMQQKLAIAVALLAGTEIILLDEPTLGLDVETGYQVRELLREIAAEGHTIIISTHDMPVVQDLCHRTVIIDDGRVVADDRVSNLLKLFQTRAFDVKLAQPLAEDQVRRLQAKFPALTMAPEGTTLRVNLERDEEIYHLIELLRTFDARLQSLGRTTIDFEQVFRDIVNGRKQIPADGVGEARARVSI